MKFKNKIIFILILVILVIIGYFIISSYEEGMQMDANHRTKQNSQKEQNNTNNDKLDNKEQEFQKSTESSEEIRQSFIRAVEAQISEFSPVEPVLGGHWQIFRVWFASDLEAYVEYDDGHIMRRIILFAKDAGMSGFEVGAYFEPGQDDWELINGQDILFGKNLDLYEHDDETEAWIKKN